MNSKASRPEHNDRDSSKDITVRTQQRDLRKRGFLFQRATLVTVFSLVATCCFAEDRDYVAFPVFNLGLTYPNGLEMTAGSIIFGTVKQDTIEGPTIQIRYNTTIEEYGVSVGPGYIAELDLGGFGGNIWFSQNFRDTQTSSQSFSIEGYLRLFLLELRIGMLERVWIGGSKKSELLPVVGVNIGF